MKSKFIVFITLFLSMALFLNTADARRFGGARSFGKSWSNQSHRSYTPSNNPYKRSAASPNRKGSFRGAFMGLLAGSLIGSLLFGGGLHGFHIFDFLLVAGLLFLALKLFQRKRSVAVNQSANSPNFHHGNSMFGNLTSATSNTHKAEPYPAWFDEKAFIEGAKKHFNALQQAWDNNDMRTIQSYCSKELFKNISAERSTLPGQQHTEVMQLNARLLDVITEGSLVTAGIEFRALIREDNNQPAENIIEIWSIQHQRDSARGDWLIVGIEQLK